MKNEKQIQNLLNLASKAAYKSIEDEARRVMKRHPNVICFCMGMGSASYYDAGGLIMHSTEYTKPMDRFLDEFDKSLQLTGMPMKIEGADGPLIKDW